MRTKTLTTLKGHADRRARANATRRADRYLAGVLTAANRAGLADDAAQDRGDAARVASYAIQVRGVYGATEYITAHRNRLSASLDRHSDAEDRSYITRQLAALAVTHNELAAVIAAPSE